MDQKPELVCPMPCHTKECLNPAQYIVRYRNQRHIPKSFMLCQNHKNTLDGITDLLSKLSGNRINMLIEELPTEKQCCE